MFILSLSVFQGELERLLPLTVMTHQLEEGKETT